MSRIAVIGAGAWGTALANHSAWRGDDVTLWAFERDVVADVNERHRNQTFLPDAPLEASLRATNDLAEAVAGAELILSVSPSHAVRRVMQQAAPHIRPGTVVVSASKGLEPASLKRMTEVLAETLASDVQVVALSGPSFARELYERQPTACTVAGPADAATRVQAMLGSPVFRLYTTSDVVGVELGGALKNVVAIAAGILEGLGLGNNPRAALITRGLAEIARLGLAMGAQPLTFAGLAGMGDLVLTATGALSRNRTLGIELGRGLSLEEAMAGKVSVAEGVSTAQAAVALGERVGVELPIAREVCRILFDRKPPTQAVADLMDRPFKAEAVTS